MSEYETAYLVRGEDVLLELRGGGRERFGTW